MALLTIREYPDPILRKKSEPVTSWGADLETLIRDMSETLYSVPGLGLAAVQVGIPLRLFLYDMNIQDKKGKPALTVLINPVIIQTEGEIREEEGCLSLPEYREIVVRADRVTVKALNRKGKEIEVVGDGLLSRLIQHEMDHLNGVLMIDRLSSLKRNLFMKRLKKSLKKSLKSHELETAAAR
jgi:peptide deformylase